MKPSQYAKSLLAALIAGLSALAPALDGGLTQAEIVIVVLAAVVALGAVFGIPNSAPAGQAADPDLSEQDGRDIGAVDLLTVFLAVLLAVVVLVIIGLL